MPVPPLAKPFSSAPEQICSLFVHSLSHFFVSTQFLHTLYKKYIFHYSDFIYTFLFQFCSTHFATLIYLFLQIEKKVIFSCLIIQRLLFLHILSVCFFFILFFSRTNIRSDIFLKEKSSVEIIYNWAKLFSDH